MSLVGELERYRNAFRASATSKEFFLVNYNVKERLQISEVMQYERRSTPSSRGFGKALKIGLISVTIDSRTNHKKSKLKNRNGKGKFDR